MPNYDLTCDNGHDQYDQLLPVGVRPPCPQCGLPTRTLWTAAPNVIPDDIVGGVWIKNGICNDDGTPRRYDSRSEMRRAAKEKNLVNRVEHIGSKGSDKNKNTQRWV